MMIQARIIFLLLFMVSSGAICAKTWYVSPMTNKSGWQENGDGSNKNPWDLQTALTGGGGMVMPGDTIYVHDGAPYWGYKIIEINGALAFAPQLYTCTLKGKQGAPIIVKAYPGEHPVLDGGISTTPEAFAADKNAGVKAPNAILLVSGSYTWIWGLEITNSSKKREANDPDGGGIQRIGAVSVLDADNIKLINLVIHDNTETGISAFSSARNIEIEGCVIYYNGYVAIKPKDSGTPNGNYKKNGPGIYTQNRSDSTGYSKKTIRNNIIFEQFYNGVQVYGSGHSFIQNYDFTGNTLFNNGLISKTSEDATDLNGDYNLIMGGQTDGWDLNISNNQICYFSKYGAKANAKIGYNESNSIHHCIIDSNIFVAGVTLPGYITWPLIINNVLNSEFKSNLVYGYGPGISLNYIESLGPGWEKDFSKNFISNKNEYIYWPFSNKKPDFLEFRLKPKNENIKVFSYNLFKGAPRNWADTFGLDKQSEEIAMNEYKVKLKNGLKVIITPDAYEPGLAKVVVFNWDSLPEISFSASDFIPSGNLYYCNDVQDYSDSDNKIKFYDKGKVNLKMTDLKAAVPTGLAVNPAMVQPEHTDARFGVYWLKYFPYALNLEFKNRALICNFKNAQSMEVRNPPFLTYSWTKDGKVIIGEDSFQCPTIGDGIYEITVVGDMGLGNRVRVKVESGKIIR